MLGNAVLKIRAFEDYLYILMLQCDLEDRVNLDTRCNFGRGPEDVVDLPKMNVLSIVVL